MPKRGDICPVTGHVWWDTSRGFIPELKFKSYSTVRLAARKFHYEKNKKSIIQKAADYQKNTNYSQKPHVKEMRRLYSQRVYPINKNRMIKNNSARIKRLRETDPVFKLRWAAIQRTGKIIRKSKLSATKTIPKYLGASLPEIKSHLESLFSEGMNWENWGNNGWQLDHIIPISFAKTTEEILALCHYTNLQPLWAKDNLIKSNKIDDVVSARAWIDKRILENQ